MSRAAPSLAHLQDRVKRDPSAYRDEFDVQHRNYLAELELFKLQPSNDSETFRELVSFMSHVAPCYPAIVAEFPVQVASLVEEHHDVLFPEVRRCLVQALVLLRNRKLTDAVPHMKLMFKLFRCKDKLLRELVFNHIVSDIRAVNRVHKDLKLNKAIQAFMYTMLADEDTTAAKRSLDVMITLYRKRVWTDAKTVNVIATACLSKKVKLIVTAIRFFLNQEDSSAVVDSDDEDGSNALRGAEAAKNLHKHSKHTKKRARQAARVAARTTAMKTKDVGPVFPAIQLLHDPQGLAEKMFRNLKSSTDGFDVKLMLMNFISRLIGQHKLHVLGFYSFIQRYLNAHQNSVTLILAYLAQACHNLLPPEELVPVVRMIANNFVSDHRPSEVIQIGLNTLREVFQRTPLVLEEDTMQDLVQDLVQYRKYRDNGVVMAARSLMNVIRAVFPTVLHRRDRGKFHDPEARPTQFGALKALDHIPGTEALDGEENAGDWEVDSSAEEDSDDESGDWVDVSDSEDDVAVPQSGAGAVEREDEDDEEDDEDEDEDEEKDDDEDEDEDDEDDEDEDEDNGEVESGKESDEEPAARPAAKKKVKFTSMSGDDGVALEEKPAAPVNIENRLETVRFLTPKDFERLAKVNKEKGSASARPAKGKKAAASKSSGPIAEDVADDVLDAPVVYVDPMDLQGQAAKKRLRALERMQTAEQARAEKYKIGGHGGGTSNTEKIRTKNFLMVRKSSDVQQKMKRHLQAQLRNIRKHVNNKKKSDKRERRKRRRL